ncbi:MAG: DEAD/DEAH box helicase [Ignavibacteriales bacterium]|nr:MAG: DEAD/DEAH box helicase [Ignavibacteriales bacterium]
MTVDIKDGFVMILDYRSKLESYQVHQLDYWGFNYSKPYDSLISTQKPSQLLLKIVQYFDKEEIKYEFSTTCRSYYNQLQKENEEFRSYIERARFYKNADINVRELNEFISFLKKSIPRKLKEHQVKAALHLSYIRNGANFSVPGSGKTAVVLTVFEKLRLEDKVNCLFVVGPPSCFGPWRNEFKETLGREPNNYMFAGDIKINRETEYYKTEKFHELYLTTFHTLLNDIESVIEFLSNKNLKVFFVIDEAHYIKQINGNWASAVIKCAEYTMYRCVLTGTPIPKSYEDLFNLIEVLWPQKDILTSEEKFKLKKLEAQRAGKEAKQILDKKIGPIFYRVRKKELGLKKQNFIPPIQIKMNKFEKTIYDSICNKLRNSSKNDYLVNVNLIQSLIKGRMIRLRQATSYIKLLSTSIQDYNEEIFSNQDSYASIIQNYDQFELPAKLEYLINIVSKFQKEKKKIVIWSNFIGTIKLIEDHLNLLNIYNKKIIGETPIQNENIIEGETREKIRNEFIDSRSGLNVLIANPAACAESISLHKTCFDAIYYDLSYNCSQYLQSLDRIHRVGGSELHEANYYFLQYRDTIDTDILNNLKRKAKKMYDIIEDDYSIYLLDMFDDEDEVEAYKRLFNPRYINE